MDAGYWIVVQGKQRKGYFVRFLSHTPLEWAVARRRSDGYCFESAEDADRVLTQFARHGGATANLVSDAPKAARTYPEGTVSQPPDYLESWVLKILNAGFSNSPAAAPQSERVRTGFRQLALACHPD